MSDADRAERRAIHRRQDDHGGGADEARRRPGANFTRLGVNTTNGIVTLTGVADTFEEKARAEELATKVSGVTHVQNQVQVRTPAASPR